MLQVNHDHHQTNVQLSDEELLQYKSSICSEPHATYITWSESVCFLQSVFEDQGNSSYIDVNHHWNMCVTID